MLEVITGLYSMPPIASLKRLDTPLLRINQRRARLYNSDGHERLNVTPMASESSLSYQSRFPAFHRVEESNPERRCRVVVYTALNVRIPISSRLTSDACSDAFYLALFRYIQCLCSVGLTMSERLHHCWMMSIYCCITLLVLDIISQASSSRQYGYPHPSLLSSTGLDRASLRSH